MVSVKTQGIIFVLMASVFWALETVVAKLSFSTNDFLQIVFQQGMFCLITVLVFIIITRMGKEEYKKIRSLSKRDLAWVAFIGFLGSFIAYIFFYYGISKTYALNANLLVHTQPIFVVLFGLYFLKERLNSNDITGGLLMLLSAVLISSRTVLNIFNLKLLATGDLMVIIATFFYAAIVIPAKALLKKVHPASLIAMRFLISTIMFVILLSALGKLKIFSLYGCIIGVITGLGYILYYHGLKRLKACQTSMVETSTPLFTAVLAFFLLGEVITALQIFGMVLLFSGIYFLSRKEKTASLAEV